MFEEASVSNFKTHHSGFIVAIGKAGTGGDLGGKNDPHTYSWNDACSHQFLALADEGIVGTWKRPNGTIISYASCGANKFCGTVQTGEYKGKSIGTMSGTGAATSGGEVNKLDEGKPIPAKPASRATRFHFPAA